jgi:hypothetical protein
MLKYETRNCTIFYLPENPTARKVDFYSVKIALGSWDEEEDHEDEGIFYYMDGQPLEVGMILSDGFVVTEIEEIENA